MSVQTNLYVMLAAEIPFPKGEEYEKLEKYIESAYEKPNEDFSIVDDSMCGKYCFAGRVLAKSKDINSTSPELYGDVDFAELPMITGQDKEDVATEINNRLGLRVTPDDVRFIVLFHYT